MSNLATVIKKPAGFRPLPDNKTFINRFEVKSASSDALYVVAQSKTGRWWSCSCFGWIRYRHCKHLKALSLPGNHVPYEALLK